MQLLHLQKKKRSGILSNLQPDNSIHVTHPDKGRKALDHIKQSRLLLKGERNSIRYLQIHFLHNDISYHS